MLRRLVVTFLLGGILYSCGPSRKKMVNCGFCDSLQVKTDFLMQCFKHGDVFECESKNDTFFLRWCGITESRRIFRKEQIVVHNKHIIDNASTYLKTQLYKNGDDLSLLIKPAFFGHNIEHIAVGFINSMDTIIIGESNCDSIFIALKNVPERQSNILVSTISYGLVNTTTGKSQYERTYNTYFYSDIEELLHRSLYVQRNSVIDEFKCKKLVK